jgi:CTP:phosphocholine cytidylyltransferase-like protein
MSNLELKKQYGPSQMDIIAQYEENFSEYLKALTKWAVSLAPENQNDAIVILEAVVALGGEFRDSYKVAADIYMSKNDKQGMENLITNAEKNHFRDPAVRSHILEYIYLGRKRIMAQ